MYLKDENEFGLYSLCIIYTYLCTIETLNFAQRNNKHIIINIFYDVSVGLSEATSTRLCWVSGAVEEYNK